MTTAIIYIAPFRSDVVVMEMQSIWIALFEGHVLQRLMDPKGFERDPLHECCCAPSCG